MDKKYKNPEIRFKGFTEDWEDKTLGSLFEITSASRVLKNEWTESGVPFFRSSDVVSDYKKTDNTKAFISLELYKKLSTISGCVQKNDILVTGGGSIGIPYLVKSNEPLYFKDADLLWLKSANKVSGYFLYTFFSTTVFRNYVNSITHIGTISHYTIEQAKSTPIITPNPTEQKQIGTFFQNLDNLITLHQKKYDKLVILKKAMLVKMFPKNGALVPEIRFKEFSGDWEATSFGKIFNYERPDNYIVKSVEYSSDFNTPVLTANKGFILGYTNEKNTFKEKCIIFDDFTLDNKYVDFHFMVKSSALKILMLKNKNIHNLLFSFNLLNTTKIEIMGHARHYISVVQNTSVLVPKIEEQQKIGKYFQNLENQIALHKTQLEKLNTIKKACSSKMFVGQD